MNAIWTRFGIAALIFGTWFVAIIIDPKDAQPETFSSCIQYALVAIGAYHANDLANGRLTPSLKARVAGGILLFGMWVVLVATRNAPASNLVNAAVIALAGLGLFPAVKKPETNVQPVIQPVEAMPIQKEVS